MNKPDYAEAELTPEERVEVERFDLDLGDGHTLRFTCWKPDRELNPQYADIPDVERVGAIVSHINQATGLRCWSGINFDGEVTRRIFPDGARWQVQSMEPLTLSPSLLCRVCGDHGFIREGKWVRA